MLKDDAELRAIAESPDPDSCAGPGVAMTVIRMSKGLRLCATVALAVALLTVVAAQQSAEPPAELPAAATQKLAKSLAAAQPHLKHIWRDTPPRNEDGTVNAYIEIPRGDRRKWEFNMVRNERAIDRMMPESLGGYPVNYGMVPQTISYDGDPFDALVLGPPISGGRLARGIVVGLMLIAPPLARFALRFAPPEYFALMVLGLAMVVFLAGESMITALLAMLVGLWIATIGIDLFSGESRYLRPGEAPRRRRFYCGDGRDFCRRGSVGESAITRRRRVVQTRQRAEKSSANAPGYQGLSLRFFERFDYRIFRRRAARRRRDGGLVFILRS